MHQLEKRAQDERWRLYGNANIVLDGDSRSYHETYGSTSNVNSISTGQSVNGQTERNDSSRIMSVSDESEDDNDNSNYNNNTNNRNKSKSKRSKKANKQAMLALATRTNPKASRSSRRS